MHKIDQIHLNFYIILFIFHFRWTKDYFHKKYKLDRPKSIWVRHWGPITLFQSHVQLHFQPPFGLRFGLESIQSFV